MVESVGDPIPSKMPSSHRKPDFLTSNSTSNIIEKARVADQNGKIGAETESLKSRSYVAMGLSIILPGLGQLYLGQSVKGFMLFLLFASAFGIFYLNSMPVKEWRDLTRFKPAAKENISTDNTEDAQNHPAYAIHLWTFDGGEKLMYRPSWKLKISGLIQGILCWLYAIGDGWRGRRRRRIR